MASRYVGSTGPERPLTIFLENRMNVIVRLGHCISSLRRIAVAAAAASFLAGCAAASSAPFVQTASHDVQTLPAMAAASNQLQPNCTTRVWASTDWPTPLVLGYSSSGATCITLTGASPTRPFLTPTGLATDGHGYLYVVDNNAHQVVVFDSNGNYWSTLKVSKGESPSGVCVSRSVVAVTDYLYGVDFFPSKGAQNSVSTPSHTATFGSRFIEYCAFDLRGEFFATGPSEPILYLRNYNVNVPNAVIQACSVAMCGNNSWTGMYSHIQPGGVDTLSVANIAGQNVTNFRVDPGTLNHLVFSSWAPQPVTALVGGIPNQQICQAAPSAGLGNNSTLYLTDCGSFVYKVPNATTGGPVSVLTPLSHSFGVATNPTGQY